MQGKAKLIYQNMQSKLQAHISMTNTTGTLRNIVDVMTTHERHFSVS